MYKETKNLIYINKKFRLSFPVKIFYDKKGSIGFKTEYESLSLLITEVERIKRYTDLKHHLFSFFSKFCDNSSELAYIDNLTSVVAQEWIKMIKYIKKATNG